MWVAAELGVEDKVCESGEGRLQEISGSKGGDFTPPSLRAEGQRRLRRGGDPLEGRMKGTRDLWQRQPKGPLGCTACACCLFLILELVI